METFYEQTKRRNREGEEQAAKQRAMIAKFEQDGQEDVLPAARALLGELECFLKVGCQYLEQQKTKNSDGVSGSN